MYVTAYVHDELYFAMLFVLLATIVEPIVWFCGHYFLRAVKMLSTLAINVIIDRVTEIVFILLMSAIVGSPVLEAVGKLVKMIVK
jgi:hypothetical protein